MFIRYNVCYKHTYTRTSFYKQIHLRGQMEITKLYRNVERDTIYSVSINRLSKHKKIFLQKIILDSS